MDHRKIRVGATDADAAIHAALTQGLAATHARAAADRMMAGRRAAAARGRVMGRVFGYRRGPGRTADLVVDAPQASIVARVYGALDAGATPSEVARGLREDGLGPWTARRVAATAGNPLHAGVAVWARTRTVRDHGTGSARVVAVPPDGWIVAPRPDLAIVDADVFDRVAARLAARGPHR